MELNNEWEAERQAIAQLVGAGVGEEKSENQKSEKEEHNKKDATHFC